MDTGDEIVIEERPEIEAVQLVADAGARRQQTPKSLITKLLQC